MLFTPRNTGSPDPESARSAFFGTRVQTKLAAGQSADPCEQEADRTADRIVDGTGKGSEAKMFFSPKPQIQTKKAEEQAAAPEKETAEEQPILQQQSDGTGKTKTAATAIGPQLSASKGGGEPMPESTRRNMETGFGTDFSNVRVHTDSSATDMNQQLGSNAFANGNDIYFNEGKYDPGSRDGQHLLAHELTHTVQQGASSNRIQRQDPTNLERLNSMLDSFNVPEEDVLTLLGELTGPEKITVLTGNSYRNRMASAFNVGEMIRAVRTLNPPLAQKLDWIDAAALITRAIDYSEIKGFVTAAPQSERDALKNATGQSFFGKVCTNATMKEALDDLNFDLVTKLTWLDSEMLVTSWELDYVTIKGWITAAPQTERDLLKTDAWRNFFVKVCTNVTMKEALNDLNFDLVTKLTWLKQEMTITSWELNYSDIKPWITAAQQTERDLLKTGWMDFFVDVCTNTTMVEALNDLSYDLITKLTWLEAEMTITRLELDYVTIQPWITTASRTDKDLLKTARWKSFFAAICDNTTIMTALTDLDFDFLTAIEWLLEEVSTSSVDETWLCAYYRRVQTFPAGEDVIACQIMMRDIRDGNFNTSPEHTPTGWAATAHSQMLVANTMGGMVGDWSTWNPSWQNSTNDFATWAKAATEGPPPTLVTATVINCWEMVMLAAHRAGQLSWARIHTIYTTNGGAGWGDFLVAELSYRNRIPYTATNRPVAGDIIFFDGAAHVSLAKGTTNSAGETEIYSFWPPPNTAYVSGGTPDQVKITTIEALNNYWVTNGNPAFTIEFATPHW